MKFPSYSNGGTGSLIRANEFDRIGTPYASTRRGNATIKKNGEFLTVSRDPQEDIVKRPILYLQAPFGAQGPANGVVGWGVRFGPYADTPQEEQAYDSAAVMAWLPLWNTSPAWQTHADGDTVHVGDGFVLELGMDTENGVWFSPGEHQTFALLRRPDNPWDAPVLPGTPEDDGFVSVHYTRATLLLGNQGDAPRYSVPSILALGWRDEERRYAFAIVGRSIDFPDDLAPGEDLLAPRSDYRYAVCVGNTATRLLTRHYLPGGPAPGRRWWGFKELINIESARRGPLSPYTRDRSVWCVGPGHLLALAVPMKDDFETGRIDGAPQFGPQAWRLPVGESPMLLRSRDFGVTWTTEAALFLNALNGTRSDTLRDRITTTDPDTFVDYESEVRQVFSNPDHFHAAPLGGGRVALVVAAKADSASVADAEPMQALHFFVSDASGENFVRKRWPIDLLDLTTDNGVPIAGSGIRSYELPVWPLSTATVSSFGQGSFFMLSVRFSLDGGPPGPAITPIPSPYPLQWVYRVHYTTDFGTTWATVELPTEIQHMLNSFGSYKTAQFSRLQAAYGHINLVPPPAPRFAVLEPATASKAAVMVCCSCEWSSAGNDVGEIARVFVSDPKLGPFSGFKEVDRLRGAFFEPVVGREAPVPVYVGEEDDPEYPVMLRPGFPEFDRP